MQRLNMKFINNHYLHLNPSAATNSAHNQCDKNHLYLH